MCLKDGTTNVINFDKNLFDSLKKNYACEFKDEDLAKYCAGMVNHNLLTIDNDYEIDLNIMKKILCLLV